MAIALVNKVRKMKTGHPIAKSILLYLADRHTSEGCFVSQATIAEDLELSQRSVIRYLDFLDENGFIERQPEVVNGRIFKTKYLILNGDSQSGSNGDSRTGYGDCQSKEPCLTVTTYNKEVLNGINGGGGEEHKSSSPRKRKDASLKTRPDLNGREFLNHLSQLPENKGIDVPVLFKEMQDWCAKKNKTISRQRLLRWIAKEREDVPFVPETPVKPKSKTAREFAREAVASQFE